MRRFIVGLTALLFTLPAFAGLDHWTCSNDKTVMYMVLDTDEGVFHLWDDRGAFLASAKFTETGKTKQGLPFLAAELDDGVAVGVAKQGNTLILALTSDKGSARFICN